MAYRCQSIILLILSVKDRMQYKSYISVFCSYKRPDTLTVHFSKPLPDFYCVEKPYFRAHHCLLFSGA